MICKEKAILIDEKEQNTEANDLKPEANPVFYISLVGAGEYGKIEDSEHIFDLYTKFYDFLGTNVKVKSTQDLWEFYKNYHPDVNKKYVSIYTLLEYFVKSHPAGHFIMDEFPFIRRKSMI